MDLQINKICLPQSKDITCNELTMETVELPDEDSEEVVALPDVDAESSVEVPSSSSEVEVPQSDEETMMGDKCCKQFCMQAVAESAGASQRLQDLQTCLAKATKQDADKVRFDCMRFWYSGDKTPGDGSLGNATWRKYQFCGIPMCRNAVCAALTMSRTVYAKLRSHIDEGFIEPPQDMRKSTVSGCDSLKQTNSTVMLSWVHLHLGEPLVESADVLESARKKLGTFNVHKISLLPKEDEVHWLPPNTTLMEIYNTALQFLEFPPNEVPSYSTFVRAYHKDWQGILKIRHEGQHSKCADCEKFKRYVRITGRDSDVHKVVMQEYSQHIKDMLADRRVDALLLTRARECPEKLLSVSIDSMDTAKWRCPRNLSASKDFAGLWRPECTFTVILVAGISEDFYLMDQDIIKDSNLMITLLSRSIHKAFEHYDSKGWPRPACLRIHSDNAAGETKNQHVFRWCAALLNADIFAEVAVTQFRVGHSHGPPDERFAAVRTLLADAVELQEPTDFMKKVQLLKPHPGRFVSVEKIDASFNWKSKLEPLNVDAVSLHGHTQTKKQKDLNLEAVHCFSLKQRKEWESQGEELVELPGFTPRPNDIVMEVWHHLASDELAQPSFVYVPEHLLTNVDLQNPEVAPRRSFTSNQVKEFRKTANEVIKPPWKLFRANHYLHSLVNCNQNPEFGSWVIPEITLATVPSASAAVKAEVDISPQEVLFSRRAPAPLSVGPLKRTAAKSKGAPSQPEAHEEDVELPPAENDAEEPVKAHEEDMELPPAENDAEEQEDPGSRDIPMDSQPATAPPTGSSASQGCPESMRGRHGAPSRVAVLPPGAAGSKPGKSKPKASTSKPALKKPAASKQVAGSKMRYGLLPFPEDVSGLGCPKCRNNKRIGCEKCRAEMGLVLNAEKTRWIWKDGNN